MSGLFKSIDSNYFKIVEPVSNSTDELEKSDEFVMVEAVEQVAQTAIQALAKLQENEVVEKPKTLLRTRGQLPEENGDLDLSTSTPGMAESTTSPSSQLQAPTRSPSPSGEALTLPFKPYIFERTSSSWRTIQLGDDPILRIAAPDKEGDVFIKHGNLSQSFNTSDQGIYRIQMHSGKIDLQFTSAQDP